MTKHIRDLITTRRAVLGGLASLPLLQLAGCATVAQSALAGSAFGFTSVAPTNADAVTLPPGYRFQTLIAWGDALLKELSPSIPTR